MAGAVGATTVSSAGCSTKDRAGVAGEVVILAWVWDLQSRLNCLALLVDLKKMIFLSFVLGKTFAEAFMMLWKLKA